MTALARALRLARLMADGIGHVADVLWGGAPLRSPVVCPSQHVIERVPVEVADDWDPIHPTCWCGRPARTIPPKENR